MPRHPGSARVHAAAPIAVEVKREMIDWLGPVLAEYYAGSEANGICVIGSSDWLAHPGSVGRPLGVEVHICDSGGAELPAGEIGTVWFSGGSPFKYHNDPGKTASAFNPAGWSTLGDMGYLDDEGYLYLADRRTDLIVSGGVNIYPREVAACGSPTSRRRARCPSRTPCRGRRQGRCCAAWWPDRYRDGAPAGPSS